MSEDLVEELEKLELTAKTLIASLKARGTDVDQRQVAIAATQVEIGLVYLRMVVDKAERARGD